AARPEDRYQDADSVRRDLPRVPPGYPLTHADAAPLEFPDTLDPLPPNAPGAARPERPARPSGPSMEAIRSGRVQQGFSAGSASTPTGPQWAWRWTPPGGPAPGGPAPSPVQWVPPQAMPSPAGAGPGSPPPRTPPQRTSPFATHPTVTGTGTGFTTPQTSHRRSTLIAVALGA